MQYIIVLRKQQYRADPMRTHTRLDSHRELA